MLVNVENFVRTLFSHFQKSNIDYVVLRNYERYPHFLHKPDIGLLISPKHQKILIRTFRQTCEETGCLFFLKYHRVNILSLYAIKLHFDQHGSPIESLIKVDARTYEALKFNSLMEKIPSYNYKLFFQEINRRKINKDGCEFYIFDQPDEIILLLKQWKRKRNPFHKQKILQQLNQPKIADWLQQVTKRTAHDIEQILEEPDSPSFYKVLGQCIQARWGKNNFRRWFRSQLSALNIFISRFRISLPSVFYFSGPDGAGKTTAINEIEIFLQRQNIPYKHFYTLHKILRHIGFRILWAKHLFLSNQKTKLTFKEFLGKGNGHLDRPTGEWTWRVKKRISLLTSFFDVWLGWFLAMGYRSIGYTILVETAPYDLFLKYHMPYFPHLQPVLTRLIPKPHCGFLFKASAECISKRKKELDQDEISNYYGRLEELLQDVNSNNYRTIDTEQGLDKMSIELREQVLEHLSNRFHV